VDIAQTLIHAAVQVKRLKNLELENSRLRRAVSDLTLDKLILTEAARGNIQAPPIAGPAGGGRPADGRGWGGVAVKRRQIASWFAMSRRDGRPPRPRASTRTKVHSAVQMKARARRPGRPPTRPTTAAIRSIPTLGTGTGTVRPVARL
jgi:hypothetical protein